MFLLVCEMLCSNCIQPTQLVLKQRPGAKQDISTHGASKKVKMKMKTKEHVDDAI